MQYISPFCQVTNGNATGLPWRGAIRTNTIHQHSLDQSGRLKRLKLHIEYNRYSIYYLWYTWSKCRSVELDWASNSFIIWENIGINKFNSHQRSLVSKKRKISFQSIIFIFHVPFPACLIVVLGMKVSGYPVQEILTSSSSPCGWICPITGNW